MRLRQDLQRKQLSSQVVEEALDKAYTEHSEEALIDRAIEKRLRLKGAPASREEAKKLFDYLLRRGFSYDLVLKKVRALNRLAADSEEDYVRIAAELAHDLPRLRALRATMRERMRGSALMDAPRFARHVEAAYREMWRRWCAEAP